MSTVHGLKLASVVAALLAGVSLTGCEREDPAAATAEERLEAARERVETAGAEAENAAENAAEAAGEATENAAEATENAATQP